MNYKKRQKKTLRKITILYINNNMVNYKNSKIYTIRSHHTNLIYIGSTCNELRKRLHQHKSKYKGYLNGKCSYISSFEIVKYNDAYIELYEYYPCNNKVELLKKEGELIRELDCVNKRISGIYKREKYKEYNKEYRKNNKENIKEVMKEYRKNNKEKIQKNRKEYRKKKYNCYCGSTLILNDKSTHNKTIKHRTYIFNLHNELNHL